MYDEWSYQIESVRAELEGLKESLGGALDLEDSFGIRAQIAMGTTSYFR